MTPESLLLVADELITAPGPGAPAQARLRRSISTSYYAAFHAALEVCASQGAGVTADADAREAIRRSVSHSALKATADRIIKAPQQVPTVQERGRAAQALAYQLRRHGWSSYMSDFRTLQEQRHIADYDLSFRVYLQAARTAHAQAQHLCAFLLQHKTGNEGRAFYVLAIS